MKDLNHITVWYCNISYWHTCYCIFCIFSRFIWIRTEFYYIFVLFLHSLISNLIHNSIQVREFTFRYEISYVLCSLYDYGFALGNFKMGFLIAFFASSTQFEFSLQVLIWILFCWWGCLNQWNELMFLVLHDQHFAT